MNRLKDMMMKDHLRKRIVLLILFLSGFTALIYQVIWIRKFGLVFGVHVFSMSTVLTAFMAGLAFGSKIFGNIVDKKKNPLKIFFFLELGIGLFALLFPFLFDGLTGLYKILLSKSDLSQYSVQLIRFILAFFFLLIPTTLMGGTLPVIIKYFVKELKTMGGSISKLYSLNNIGAMLGAFFAGFMLINNLGLQATLVIGALLNMINVLLTFLIIPRKETKTSPEITEEPEHSNEQENTVAYPKHIVRLALWIFAIEGFTTLAYEVIWSRIFIGYSFDKTTYFYTTILMAFIFGLSFGSFLIRPRIDKIKNLATLLGAIEIIIGIVSVVLLVSFAWIASKLIVNRSVFDSWLITSVRDYAVFFIILSIPTTLMGMTYPIVSKIYANSMKNLGNKMGTIGFLDTVGSILGSFVAGFLFIPFLGVVKSFLIVALINIIIGFAMWLFHPQKSVRFKLVSFAAIVLISFGLYQSIPGFDYFSWWDKVANQDWWGHHYERVVFYDEGEAATVVARQYPDEDMRSLVINGHHTAYTTMKDLSVNRQLAYMPYILHPDPKNAMVIGFGLGATSNSCVQPRIEEVDIAEICPGVIKAAPTFAKWNDNVAEHPKVNIHDEDGRSWLFMADKKYDIITSNAIHPRLSNNIYTRDFYEICRDKLTDDGIVCQWMPQNWISEDEYKSCLKAFTDVFPHSTLWYVNEYSTHIIGSKTPIHINYDQVVERFNEPKVYKELTATGIMTPEVFLAQYFMSEEDLAEYLKDAPVNTDNHPIVAFSKVINIAPVVNVMDDLGKHKTDYEVLLADIATEDKKAAVRKNINDYSKFIRSNIQSIIKNVEFYVNQQTN